MNSGNASDADKEQRLADQIIETLFDGEPVWLEGDGPKFFGIYISANNTRSAIILHGMGVHPNSEHVVYPLRVALPEHGFSTLSIQLPVLSNDAQSSDYAALFDEAVTRIQSAVAYLRQRNSVHIYLIGHSLGASMGAYFLSKNQDAIAGFVSVSIGASPVLNKIHIPVLDLYGSDDFEGVKSTAETRVDVARQAGISDYLQIVVDGADHFFSDKDDELVNLVVDWLESY